MHHFFRRPPWGQRNEAPRNEGRSSGIFSVPPLYDTGYDAQGDESTDFSSNGPASSNFDSRSPQSSAASSVPPRAEELDRTLRHTGLKDFGKALEDAAKAAFPNDKKSKYSRVYVLLISWQTEDPRLPVAREISTLREVLEVIYHYEVEEFCIPDLGSHAAVSKKINTFVEVNGDCGSDLKIVYYAGHSSLSRNKELIWSTLPVNAITKIPKVVWTGIQRSLEMAQSDVLILLDCCWSGIANDTEGNGVTELICACPFDGRANGVGHYSFTQALTTELRLLSKTPCFSVGKLYTAIYTRMQSYLMQGFVNERYPPPVHFVLSQNESFIRGIQLSVLDTTSLSASAKNVLGKEGANRKRNREGSSSQVTNKRINTEDISQSEPGQNTLAHDTPDNSCQSEKEGLLRQEAAPSDQEVSSSPVDETYSLDAPRALFAIRFREDIKAQDLSIELFLDWLRSIPAAAEEVRVEASFECFSTLLFVTLPLSMASYMPQDPAIFPLGAVKSSITLPAVKNDLLLARKENGLSGPLERVDNPSVCPPLLGEKTGVLQEVKVDKNWNRKDSVQDSQEKVKDAIYTKWPANTFQRKGGEVAEVPVIPNTAGSNYSTLSSLLYYKRRSSQNYGYDSEYAYGVRRHGPFSSSNLATNRLLIRTSTIQHQQMQSPEIDPQMGRNIPSKYLDAYALYPKIKLEIQGDLGTMAQFWTEEELERKRRLVQFRRVQSGTTITATFEAVSQDDRPPLSVCISCIYWEEKQEHFVTIVDVIYLLEQLAATRFTFREKSRIRRDLERFRPITVFKTGESEEIYKIIVSFPAPKPQNIDKDIKVVRWKDLGSALNRIIGEYSSISTSTLPPDPSLPTPTGSADSVDSYSAEPHGPNHEQLKKGSTRILPLKERQISFDASHDV